jgi:UDP-N-acetylmuramyl pentapeptide phosphotransferase/UDP-N-acetylglucosamine-1-phosphate transferase
MAATAGCFWLWCVDVIVPRPRFNITARALAHLAAQIMASALLVWAGVRFDLMKMPGEEVAVLGYWESQIFTLTWLVLATNVIRLLDGIHGAAAVAVCIAGLTALLPNVINQEYFLAGVSLVAIGCAVGSLWFCCSRSKLPLEGAGTAILGFLFAILTVLARQKTVATLLLLVPLVIIILLAGAATLGMLEKRLVLPKNKKSDE